MFATTTPAERVAELRRELATKERVYPDWVRTQRHSKATADHRLAATRDALTDLFALHNPVPASPHPMQASLFGPKQMPPSKPTPSPYTDH